MSKDNRLRAASFVRVVDGDTFIASIRTMPGVNPEPRLDASIRVYQWSAVELSHPEGAYMRAKFEQALITAKAIDLQLRGMSYHRIVCSVWLDDVLFAGYLTDKLQQLRMRHA